MDNVDGFIEITHCLGLNDTLWVKPVGSSLHWTDVSLYTNNFSDVMEKTAFGNGLNGIEISSTDLTSPEFGFAILSEYIDLNFERIKHKNNNLKRIAIEKSQESLADYLSDLDYKIEDEEFTLQLSRDDFLENKYLSQYKTLYGLSSDEHILIRMKNGAVSCYLTDEFGESEIGKELLGSEDVFKKKIQELKWHELHSIRSRQ